MLKHILKWPVVGTFFVFLVIGAAVPFFAYWQTEQLAAENAVVEASREKEVNALTYQQPIITLAAEEMPIMGTLTASRTIALLIDNSWNNTISSTLIFALKSNHAHATFFIAGRWAGEHPDICRLIAGEGNELGVLGNQYEQYDKQPLELIKNDIAKSAGQIKGVSGVQPVLFSAGNGVINPIVVKTVAGMGYRMVTGKVDANNHISANPDMIIGRLLQSAGPGSIVVFHVREGTSNLASTIDTFLKRMEQQNYQVVSVSELLSRYGEKGVVRKPLQ
ncbi:MAG: polysaccharide deacetylase family protein [Pelosinus sp.]|nr:polysaccharide deacetylase family protein [Pelosinus sp.]